MPYDRKVIEELIQKTFQELQIPEKPQTRSRVWQSPNGYIFLVAWSNASLLRVLVRTFTRSFPRSEYRLKAQLDDAARSVIANIEEGFTRPTTAEYLTYLGFSEASLREVKGDIQRSLQDGFIKSDKGSNIAEIGIDLKVWHEVLKRSVISITSDNKGSYRKLEDSKESYDEKPVTKNCQSHSNSSNPPLKSFKFLYPPVDNLQANQLTYEIFIELINKTDWHLRKLVESLEKKLTSEKKYYQVEQARIRSKIHWQ